MPPEFDRAAAARMIAAPLDDWRRMARQSLPKAEPETIERAAQTWHGAAQALPTLGGGRWQARGLHWRTLMDKVEPPDDDAAVSIGATLAVILQVVPSEAAQLVRHGKTLSAEIPDAKERVRRADQRVPQAHKIAPAHIGGRERAPRTAGRERRERHSAQPTRAGPSDDDDGPAGPRPPRPSRSRRPSSDLTRYPRRRSR